MVLRIAGLANKSTNDGPGVRFTVYAQGCPHRCDGCDIPQAHSFEGGTLCDVEELWETITQSGGIEGITLSGGEPFCQSGPMAELARRAKEKGLSVWTYTGYTFEELLDKGAGGGIMELLAVTDVLIDGPFVLCERTAELPYRGSANQRLIDVHDSLDQGKAVSI